MIFPGKRSLWAIGGLGVTTAVIAALSFSPVCAGRPTLDTQGEMSQLEASDRIAAAERRAAIRDQLTTDVIAGQISLLEAAASFHELNGEDEATWRVLHLLFPNASDEEACCRQVLSWVRARLDREPDRGRPVLQRLEAELAEYLDGSLPSPSARESAALAIEPVPSNAGCPACAAEK